MLNVGDNAPQSEWLTQNANEETLVLFMGQVARPNSNGKSKSLVQAMNNYTIKDLKICLVWDGNAEEVQEFKSTIPGLTSLNNVCDVYDVDQTIEKDWQVCLPDSENNISNQKFYIDALVKQGKISWIQDNKTFYEVILLLRGWRP